LFVPTSRDSVLETPIHAEFRITTITYLITYLLLKNVLYGNYQIVHVVFSVMRWKQVIIF